MGSRSFSVTHYVMTTLTLTANVASSPIAASPGQNFTTQVVTAATRATLTIEGSMDSGVSWKKINISGVALNAGEDVTVSVGPYSLLRVTSDVAATVNVNPFGLAASAATYESLLAPRATSILSHTFNGSNTSTGGAGTFTGANNAGSDGNWKDVTGGHWNINGNRLVGTFGAGEGAAWIANSLTRPASEAFMDGLIEVDLAQVASTGWCVNINLRQQAGGDRYFASLALSTLTPTSTNWSTNLAVWKVVSGTTTQVGKYSQVGTAQATPIDFTAKAYTLRVSITTEGGYTTITVTVYETANGTVTGDPLVVVDNSATLQLPGTWGLSSHSAGVATGGSITLENARLSTYSVSRPLWVGCLGDSNTYGAGTSSPAGATAMPAQLQAICNQKMPSRSVVAYNGGISGTHSGTGASGWASGSTNLTNFIAQIPTYGEQCVVIALGTNDAGNLNRIASVTYAANIKGICDALIAARPNVKIILNAPCRTSPTADNGSQYYDVTSQGLVDAYAAALPGIVAQYPNGNVQLGDTKFLTDSAYHFADWYTTETVPASPLSPRNPTGKPFWLHLNNAGSTAWATRIQTYIAAIFGSI